MKKAVIITAKRTAIGKIGGIFKHTKPENLAAHLIDYFIQTYKLDPYLIDEVILGNAIGPGGNLARLTALTAKLPIQVPGLTIDRQCGSGLEAINIACRHVQSGAGDIYLAGGVESSSLAPWKIEKPASLYQTPNIYDRAPFSSPHIGDPSMGEAADEVAKQFNISREAQDLFAYESHQKAIKAQDNDIFENEIIPFQKQNKDEGPRHHLSLKFLQKLKPLFTEDGTVTAGNSCPINDGAAIALIMSEEKAMELNIQPSFHFVDATSAGVHPNILGTGPIPAVEKLLKRNELTIEKIGLIEFNEAFASQVLASMNTLKIDKQTLNKGGGAIAFGHPYGASGAVLMSRLCTEIKRTDTTYALATLGIAGGLGIATLLKRYDKYE